MMIITIFAPTYVDTDVGEKKFPAQIDNVAINGKQHIFIKASDRKLLCIREGVWAEKNFNALDSEDENARVLMFVMRPEGEAKISQELWGNIKTKSHRVIFHEGDGESYANCIEDCAGTNALTDLKSVQQYGAISEDREGEKWAAIRDIMNNIKKGITDRQLLALDKLYFIELLDRYIAWMILHHSNYPSALNEMHSITGKWTQYAYPSPCLPEQAKVNLNDLTRDNNPNDALKKVRTAMRALLGQVLLDNV